MNRDQGARSLRGSPRNLPCRVSKMSDASLFLHIALSLSFVGLVGLGIGRALDAWVRLAPTGTDDEGALAE